MPLRFPKDFAELNKNPRIRFFRESASFLPKYNFVTIVSEFFKLFSTAFLKYLSLVLFGTNIFRGTLGIYSASFAKTWSTYEFYHRLLLFFNPFATPTFPKLYRNKEVSGPRTWGLARGSRSLISRSFRKRCGLLELLLLR